MRCWKVFSVVSVVFGGIVSADAAAFDCSSQLWNGENPARALAVRLEPTFKHVTVLGTRVVEVVAALATAKQKVEIPAWDYPPYLQSADPVQVANFLLVMNANNFSFFTPGSGEPFRAGKESGATLATKRLAEAWKDLRDPQFLRQVDEAYIKSLFQADELISMVEARTRVLREAGDFLLSVGPKGVLGWMEANNLKGAGPIAVSIPVFLPSWRDPFLKRTQLFVGMLFGRFQRSGNPIDPTSLGDLTVFADYRLPQTLRAMGILQLPPNLEAHIEAGKNVPPGSDLEIELRAASILAGDRLVEEMNRNGTWGKVSVLEVDYLLWSVGRSLQKGIEMPGVIQRKTREHRTVTTDY